MISLYNDGKSGKHIGLQYKDVWRGEYAPWSCHRCEIATRAVYSMHQLVLKNRMASPTN